MHALASETSPSQLINHVTCVDVPPSPTLPRSIININVTTTRHPSTSSHHLINRSVVPPGFPCIPPSSSVVDSSHPIISIKTKRPLKSIVSRCFKRSPPSTTVKIVFHLVTLDTSLREVPLGSRADVVEGLLRGFILVLFTHFRTFPCLALVLDLFHLLLPYFTLCPSCCRYSINTPSYLHWRRTYHYRQLPELPTSQKWNDFLCFYHTSFARLPQTTNRAREPSRSSPSPRVQEPSNSPPGHACAPPPFSP